MSNIATRFVLATLVSVFTSAAFAKPIPLEIHWSGDPPTDVLVNTDGGFQSLQRDTVSHVFRGALNVGGNAPERRTITVRYGSYYHPFDIRIHRLLPLITFAVDHSTPTSCTSGRVDSVGRTADNLPDAVNRAVAAGQLTSIPEPNACRQDLRFEAVQARFRQSAAMSELSNGFFLINREIEAQYKQEARARRMNVDQEVAARVERDATLEAAQLLAFRAVAQASQNYAVALQANELIAARLSSDQATAAAYAQYGVSRAQLGIQQQYLATLERMEETQAVADQMQATTEPPNP